MPSRLSPSNLYFAYGSNLCPRQMAERCPTAVALGRATLPGYRLVFPRRASDWEGGGVAGIEPDEQTNVEGVLYEMQAADWAALDIYEGVEEGHYYRAQVEVLTPTGERLEATTYIAVRESATDIAPSARYVRTILTGIDAHGLPATWRSPIEAFLR